MAVCNETCLLCTQLLQENRTIWRQLEVPLYCSAEVQYMEPMCLWLQVHQHYSLWIFQLSEIWSHTLVYGFLCSSYICPRTTMKMRYKSPLKYWYLCSSLITSYSKGLILYLHHCENLRFLITKSVSLNMFLSMAAVVGVMSHMKPASAVNLDFTFPLQFSLP